MYCRSCGTENADDAKTCTACGAVLTNPFQTTTPVSTGGEGKPNNYLVWAVISNICCCPIFGVVAVIYAAQVDALWNTGDRAGAVLASKNAFKWVCIAIGVGVLINLFVFGIQALGIVAANQQAAGAGGGF